MINIGFTKKEACVYLAALELGSSGASEIALRAKLNRVTTYDVLEKLIHKGFINTYIQQKIRYFTATDPDIVKTDYQQRFNGFKATLPDLRRLHGKTAHPNVNYYEGIEAIKKVYWDTLTAQTEILNYADSKSIRRYWPAYDEEYVAERVKKKIYLRGIAPNDMEGALVVAKNRKTHREIRLVNPGEFPFTNEINIYDNKVSIISFGKEDVLGMLIESQEIADTQRAIFMMAWMFSSKVMSRG
ncbi:MAG: transcriptional regulator TrmB [Candidatus Peregrinibacteria bacterium GW2011_GWE2_39_6]|nr:MAG: transcriptional regulator TrmB [Candidatus Peregrinibacteria bacterium GW2011_GWF2_39_17]KKR24783.1 MAG: transcriptional regulator TrmB [Candidatus Peregrinibacteria bacterium GW2011_GWE2_39_6]